MLVVGDVLFVFMVATQPELPLGLRLWPVQVVPLSQSTLSMPNPRIDVRGDATFYVSSLNETLGGLTLQVGRQP